MDHETLDTRSIPLGRSLHTVDVTGALASLTHTGPNIGSLTGPDKVQWYGSFLGSVTESSRGEGFTPDSRGLAVGVGVGTRATFGHLLTGDPSSLIRDFKRTKRK